ncbi:MAG: hypothetical protein KBF33_11885 [Comamonas sp.]|nr:hypothetical protein [Comamonas sp.]
MTNFARIIDNVAVDVSAAPEDHYHPALASQFVAVPAQVRAGWRLNGETWEAPTPVEPEPVPEPVPTYPTVGPIHFQMLFTSEEAVAAEAACSTNPALNRFWKLIEDPRTDVVNLGLQSVQEAVEYTLTVAKGAGVELDVPTRKAEILSGVLN